MSKKPKYVMTESGRILLLQDWEREQQFNRDWKRLQEMERLNKEWQEAQENAHTHRKEHTWL